MKIKFGQELWLFGCAYGAGSDKDKTERKAF